MRVRGLGRLRRRQDQAARVRFLADAERYVTALGLEVDGGVLLIPSDASPRRKLFLRGGLLDVRELARVVDFLRERGLETRGSTFVDVGANLGTTSLAAVGRHGFARSIACEPDPENARYLRATMALNGLDETVSVVQAAVARDPGSAIFDVGRRTPTGRLTGKGSLRATPESAATVEVEVVSLDLLVERGLDPAAVGLVWMDVQGYEGFVLAGAARLLGAGVPVVSSLRGFRLAEAKGTDLFIETVTSQFSGLVDLRSRGGGWKPTVEDPRAGIERLLAERGTDVLLLP